MNSAVKSYLRDVKKRIICPRSIREPFLRQLTAELEGFCTEQPEADAILLAETFGTPEEVAREFLAELGEQSIGRWTHRRRQLLCIAAAVVLLAAGAVVFISLRKPPPSVQLQEDFIASVTYQQEEGAADEEAAQGDIFVSQKDTELQEKEAWFVWWYD